MIKVEAGGPFGSVGCGLNVIFTGGLKPSLAGLATDPGLRTLVIRSVNLLASLPLFKIVSEPTNPTCRGRFLWSGGYGISRQ